MRYGGFSALIFFIDICLFVLFFLLLCGTSGAPPSPSPSLPPPGREGSKRKRKRKRVGLDSRLPPEFAGMTRDGVLDLVDYYRYGVVWLYFVVVVW